MNPGFRVIGRAMLKGLERLEEAGQAGFRSAATIRVQRRLPFFRCL